MSNKYMKRLAVALLLTLVPTSSTGEQPFDHGDQHCHDVSIYDEVDYQDKECKKCTTEFEKVCHESEIEECGQVPEVTCELVPYTECEMFMEDATYNETEMVTDGEYVPIECNEFVREEMFTKLVPHCEEVTRLDCVTKWIQNVNGDKIWDGNEDCTPVTWQNCTLVAQPKRHNQTYTECKPTGKPIPTMDCRMVERTRPITGMSCVVKHSVDCQTTTKEECKTITVQECREEPRPMECESTALRVPFQQIIHRVKCLLVDETDSPELDADEHDQAARSRLRDSDNGAGGDTLFLAK